nr:uncharacterized protein LOC112036320 [Quercus suber]
MKTILTPQGQKYKLFAATQEACRKDVEHAFEVLQARFAIVYGLARFFHFETLQKIMKACIILHDMIVEDEWDDNEVVDLDYEQIDGVDNPPLQVLREQSDGFLSYIERNDALETKKFIFNSNWTSLNIYGNYKFTLFQDCFQTIETIIGYHDD